VISIARNLGNAFAWVFYHKDQGLIRKHLAKQPQLLIPPGIGGIGERWLAENFLRTDRGIVLHHGITSFLRIGDISVVDPATGKVDCIGEIKTERLSDTEARISLNLISGSRDALPFRELTVRKNTEEPRLPPKVQGRLNRQVKAMGEAVRLVERASWNEKFSRNGEFYLKDVEELVTRANKRRFTCKKLGDGLLLAAVRLGDRHALAKNLTRKGRNPSRVVAGMEKEVLSIVKDGAADNALWLGPPRTNHGYPQFHAAMTPLPLWSISPEVRRALVFGEVLMVSAFNPAHFHERLRQIGYKLELGEKCQLRRATRPMGMHRQLIENSNYFYDIITEYFMSEDDILEILEKTADIAKSRGANTRVDLELVLHM
jgi:hypothetical protein